MTIELKSCYGWVVLIIIIQMSMMSIFIYDQTVTIPTYEAEKTKCISQYDDEIYYWRCTNYMTERVYVNQHVLLISHLFVNGATFVWINSRQGWVKWVGCD